MQDINKTRSMIELVEQWLESGKSQRQFSSENGIPLHTLGYWIKKHRESQLSHRGFASLTVSAQDKLQPAQARVEIELGEGLVVRIY